MEIPPALVDALVSAGGFGVLVWFLISDRKEARARDAAKDAVIASLNEKLVNAYREALPVLGQASHALELVGEVLPAIAAAEPKRITGGKTR